MKSLARTVARVGLDRAKHILDRDREAPVDFFGLASMTLDDDDAALAREWLKRREAWKDEGEVETYHREFASWNGSRSAFSFMAGRVALSSLIEALGLDAGDEVLIPGYTCVVVPNAFALAGVAVVYADIELETYGLDAKRLEERITPSTRAILLHHLYGLVCRDYEEIIRIARRHGLSVIEDCTQATGAEYQGQKVGHRGDVAFYSSEQSKLFDTIQGGVATTNDPALAERLRDIHARASYASEELIERQLVSVITRFGQVRGRQRPWRTDWERLRYRHDPIISTTPEEYSGARPETWGQKLPAPIAALGRNQLRKLDGYNVIRRHNARRWEKWCEGHGYQRPLVISGSRAVFLRYPVLVEEAKKLDTSWSLRELGVGLGVWFTSNLHPSDRLVSGCPNADTAVRQCINFPTLSTADSPNQVGSTETSE